VFVGIGVSVAIVSVEISAGSSASLDAGVTVASESPVKPAKITPERLQIQAKIIRMSNLPNNPPRQILLMVCMFRPPLDT
jgi:hypothetical protein